MRRKVLSSALVATMILSMTACGKNNAKNDTTQTPDTNSSVNGSAATEAGELTFTPGTYTGTGTGNNGPVTVEVTFTENAIESIEIKEHKETAGICETPFERIPAAIIDGQTLVVDTVSGATNASNAVLEAVEACVVEAGGNVEALKVATGEKELVKEEMNCDVVVVGAGAAGSAAALSAAQNGANVILIEKTSTPSGAGTMAGALFATNSDLQKEAGNEVDPEWYYNTYITDSSYFANARLISTIINGSSETVNWLTENGVRLVSLKSGHGSQYAHINFPATAHGYVDGGAVAITTLCEDVEKEGGTVLFDTTGKELIFDKDGAVAGVIAETVDGRELHISADSVVIATGGFGGNAEMMAEVFGEKAGTGLIASNTGDGIKMAWSAGAAERGLDVAQWFGMKYGPEAKEMQDSKALTSVVRNPLLFVNNKGERFGNEEEAYESAALGTMMYQQPDAEMYVILTQDILDRIAEESLANVFVDRWAHLYGEGVVYMEAGHEQNLDKMTDDLRTPTDYTDVLKDAVKCGVAFEADSVEKLAEITGMANLVEEVDRYNAICEAGVDTDFYKDAHFLNPVTEGETVYAVKVALRCLTTLGGVAINEDIQAVDDNGDAVANLFVAGADAGGMYGNNYVMFEGGTLGFAYTSGRLAGANAAANAAK